MKIVRYEFGGEIHYGRLAQDGQIERFDGSPFGAWTPSGRRDALREAKLLAPVGAPRVFGVGLNYAAHAKEAGQPIPPIPMLFMKPGTAVIGPEQPIVYPRQGQRVDYECELAVVIGKTARRIPEGRAREVVLGYTCANDVSERNWQKNDLQWWRAKSSDTFGVIGPYIATDLNPGNLNLAARINGRVVQEGNTNDLLHDVPTIIEFISRVMTLEPGDVIMTGTPGVPEDIKAGDTVEVEVEGVGVLSNTVKAE